MPGRVLPPFALVAAGILAGVSPARGMETVFVPSIFEDFEGPDVVRLYPLAARGAVAARWKLETLVPAGEIGDAPLTLHRIGLRADESALPGAVDVRGALTLSTTGMARLRPRFGENCGDRPVTFFVQARPGGAGRSHRALYLFDLPGGFRFDPALDGNLVVHLEMQASEGLLLDAAPAPAPRLVLSSDLLAPVGEVLPETLVLALGIERDRPRVAPPDLSRAIPLPERRPPAGGGEPGRGRPGPAERALAERVKELEEKVTRLTVELAGVRQETQRTVSRIETDLRSVSQLVTRHYVEGSLASGQPAPALLREAPEGLGIGAGREALLEAIAAARSTGQNVGGAEALLAEGDQRLKRGDAGLAFLSYSLGYRNVLALWRPFTASPPPERVTPIERASPPPEVVPATTRLTRGAPYDIASDYPVR